ncbi:MAG TPA: ribosome maturation factor RimM [Edaphocola sp.]|nr:ribosome maturation factor RimM [Edaphocola sp.]
MDFIEIGKINASHGLSGQLSLLINTGKASSLKKIKHFFLGLKRESYIPFYIEELKVENEQICLVRFEELDSIEAAKKLIGKPVFLSTEQYKELKVEDKDVNFVGFEVIDVNEGTIGKVEQLFETPGQLLATVNYKGKEVIFPINESTLISVNIKLKSIKINLPDGLLDVYLDS